MDLWTDFAVAGDGSLKGGLAVSDFPHYEFTEKKNTKRLWWMGSYGGSLRVPCLTGGEEQLLQARPTAGKQWPGFSPAPWVPTGTRVQCLSAAIAL